jgi:hypothetical protein
MTSVERDLLTDLLRENPHLVVELARRRLPIAQPHAIEDVTSLAPPGHRADLALALRNADGVVTDGLVVVVALAQDPEADLVWPVYQTYMFARLQCLTTLVVIALDEAVATWAATPIELRDGRSVIHPFVIGPSSFPSFDIEQARRQPELALLSTLARRGDATGAALARTLLAALDDIEEVRARRYADILLRCLGDDARRVLGLETAGFRSEVLRGIAVQSRRRGEAIGLGRALLIVLEARGLAVSEDQRATVLACGDRGRLAAWLERVIEVVDVDELLGRGW